MKYGFLTLAAVAAAGVWWLTRKDAPAVSPSVVAPFVPFVPVVEAKAKTITTGASPNKGNTIDIEVANESEQMTQVLTAIGSCELGSGIAGTLYINQDGEEVCA